MDRFGKIYSKHFKDPRRRGLYEIEANAHALPSDQGRPVFPAYLQTTVGRSRINKAKEEQ